MFNFSPSTPLLSFSLSWHFIDQALARPTGSRKNAKGFDCVLFKDQLVLFGCGKPLEKDRSGRSTFCLYDLKEQKPIELPEQRSPSEISMISPTGCVHDKADGVLFYGRIEALRGSAEGFKGPFGNNSSSQQCRYVVLKVMRDYDGFLLIFVNIWKINRWNGVLSADGGVGARRFFISLSCIYGWHLCVWSKWSKWRG